MCCWKWRWHFGGLAELSLLLGLIWIGEFSLPISPIRDVDWRRRRIITCFLFAYLQRRCGLWLRFLFPVLPMGWLWTYSKVCSKRVGWMPQDLWCYFGEYGELGVIGYLKESFILPNRLWVELWISRISMFGFLLLELGVRNEDKGMLGSNGGWDLCTQSTRLMSMEYFFGGKGSAPEVIRDWNGWVALQKYCILLMDITDSNSSRWYFLTYHRCIIHFDSLILNFSKYF